MGYSWLYTQEITPGLAQRQYDMTGKQGQFPLLYNLPAPISVSFKKWGPPTLSVTLEHPLPTSPETGKKGFHTCIGHQRVNLTTVIWNSVVPKFILTFKSFASNSKAFQLLGLKRCFFVFWVCLREPEHFSFQGK